MRQLYEVDTPPDTLTDSILPTCPTLWRYRTQVTLDHFSHTFQQEVLSTDPNRNKVLAEFLRQVGKRTLDTWNDSEETKFNLSHQKKDKWYSVHHERGQRQNLSRHC